MGWVLSVQPIKRSGLKEQHEDWEGMTAPSHPNGIIGVDLNKAAIHKVLTAALLTEEENAAGWKGT
jgi:hypothetical protein